jgi:hypothetical protein
MLQHICPDGSASPTPPCSVCSREEHRREAGRFHRRPLSQARGAGPSRCDAGRRQSMGRRGGARRRTGCPLRHGILWHTRVAWWPARMRARGLVASPDLASPPPLSGWGAGTLVVATSASGGFVETLDALSRLPEAVSTVALTNTPGRAVTQCCDAVVGLDAEPQGRSVACRSYQLTLPCWRSNATSREGHRRPGRLVYGERHRYRPLDRHRIRLVPRAFHTTAGPTCATSPHRRTDSAWRSRVPSCCARARDCP